MIKLHQDNIQMLRLKIVFLPLLAIILIVIAGVFITKTMVPPKMFEEFRNQLVHQTHNIEEDVNLYFESFKNAAEIVGIHPVFLSEDGMNIHNVIQRFVESSVQISGMALYNKTGDLEALYPASETNEKINVKEREYFKRALLDRKVFLSDVTYAKTGRLVVVQGVPIIEPETGEVVKVLGISLHLKDDSFTHRLLRGSYIGFEGYTYIIDSQGVILSHPDKAWIGEKVTQVEDAKLLHIHQSKQDTVERTTTVEGVDMLTAYSNIEGLNWGVIAQIPISSMKQGNRDHFYRLVQFYAIIAISMILLTVYLTRRIMRPLYEIQNAINELIKGDYKQSIKLPFQHDLGTIIDTFNQMIEIIGKNKQELEEKAYYDSLTGLYNHRMFQEIANKEFNHAKKRGIPLSLLFIDIDRFKLVNDGLGHQSGDQVLMKLSQIIVETVRPSDTVARYGGEEIVILCPDTDISTAIKIAERIRLAINSYPFEEGKVQPNGKISVSIGVASTDRDQIASKDDLIRLTDQRMYLAKKLGRDQIVSSADSID